MILIHFRFRNFFWNTWDGSSVGRAEDWKSSCRRFNSVPSHIFNTFKIRYLQGFVSIFFYFSSAEFLWKSPNGAAVSSWFTVILSTQSVQSLYKTVFRFYRFHVNSRTWLGRSGDVCGGVLWKTIVFGAAAKKNRFIHGQIWPCMDGIVIYTNWFS